MKVERVGGLLAGGPLARTYVEDFARVSDLYRYDPGRGASFVDRAAQLDRRSGADRADLSRALVAYNQRLGGDAAALESARTLARPDALCVVTGQQAGVLTAPLYTVYKALQAVALAREMSAVLDRPVVPVFWVASEDHDFGEIHHVDVLDRQGTLQRLRLELEPPSHTSAGHIAAGEEAERLLAEFLATLPKTEFLPPLAAEMERLTAGGGSLADWFARLMAWLFRGQGLVLADPMDPSLRRLAGPFMARLLERNAALGGALAQGAERVRSLGFEPAVQWEEDSALLFTYHQGARQPLFRRGGGFATRNGAVAWSLADAARLAAEEPDRFSGNVVTRPLIQDYLFPTLAYVAGPGEVSYYGLYRPVYAAVDLDPPVYVPRANLTLIEPAAARILSKQGLTVEQGLFGLEAARQAVLEREDRLGLDRLFASFRDDFDRRYGRVIDQVLRLDASLKQVAEENLRQIHAQFNRLEDKARQQHRKNSEVAMRQFDKLSLLLMPRGQPQERVYNIFAYLSKFGPELIGELARLPLARGGHFAAWLGEA